MRLYALLLLAAPAALPAQTITFEEYDPPSTLVVPEHPVTRAKYPIIDIHSHHFNSAEITAEDAAKIVQEMDALNLRTLVNLSGGSGQKLAASVRNMDRRYPRRFITFANIS